VSVSAIGLRCSDAVLVATFRRWREEGSLCAVATVVETRNSAPRPVGSKLLINEKGEMVGSVSGGCVESAVALEAATVIASGTPILLHYGFIADQAFEVGLPCGGEIDVFVEPSPFDALDADVASDGSILFTVLDGPEIGRKLLVGPDGVIAGDLPGALGELAPSVRRSGVLSWRGQRVFVEGFRSSPRLVIVGASDIAEALAALVSTMGWRTICVDARAASATCARVPSADELLVDWPDQALYALDADEATAVIVLVHDEKFVVPALVAALESPAFYVGVLGSRRAQAVWRSQLVAAGVSEEGLARIHGPAGLDIGAATPTEIAVSIVAELLAVRCGHAGGFLRAGAGTIHRPAAPSPINP
jgi:xanthine dehydrogenase accessory factor